MLIYNLSLMSMVLSKTKKIKFKGKSLIPDYNLILICFVKSEVFQRNQELF